MLFIFTTLCNAQVGFQQNVVIDQTFGTVTPRESVIVDTNNDGYQDVIAIGSGELVWFKNIDGLGNYSKPIPILSNNYGVSHINAKDINGDNSVDLIYLQSLGGDKQIMWSQNDGNGVFGSPQQLFTLNNTLNIRLQVTDIDGDGDNDIGFGNAGYVGWLDNDDTSFTVNSLLGGNSNTGNNYDSSVFVDIDNDNRLDIIADLGYNLRAYKHETDGTVTFLETMSTFAQGKFVTGGDVDGDGDNDVLRIFVNGGGDRKIRWYENTDGAGTFANAQILFDLPDLQYTSNSDSNNLQLIDINNDDDLDIIISQSNLGRLSFYENLGAATFATESIVASSFININSFDIQDIDDNGTLDIVTTSREDNQVSWFSNTDGLGSFSTENKITTIAYSVNHVDVADFNGDGFLDLVSTSHNDNKVAWYKNIDGLGDFSEEQILISNTSPATRDAFAVDIDNDMDTDVLVRTYLDNNIDEFQILWFENDGNGNFTQEHVILTTPDDINQINYADIDNDGDFDIIYRMDYNVLKLTKNNGDGTFAAPQDITTIPSSAIMRSFKLVDMDNDSYIDIITVNNDAIVWYKNNGLGAYNSYTTIAAITNSTSVFVADINGDTFNDVLFAETFSNKVGYYLGTNAQATAFNVRVISSQIPVNPAVIYALDIDNDGDQDMITNSDENAKFIWFENDGFANFGDPIEISSVIGDLNYITNADINNDGIEDLITTSYSDSKIAWFQNLGAFTNSISGVVRLDANADGCDATDAVVPNLLIVGDNGVNTFSTFTQADGSYNLQANQENYTASISSALPNYYTSNPTSYTYDYTGLNHINNSGSNFCIEASQTINDLAVVIYPSLNEPRPGFDTSYQLVYRNNGTVPLSGGSVVFQYDDSKLNLLNASETIDTQTTNTLTFNYSDLNPFEIRTITLNFNVYAPPTTGIGDVLNNIVTVNPVGSDDFSEDNIFNLEQVLIGSYDPNDIRVLEGETIMTDEASKYLHYIIRFQNTGTASAINVRVNNVLDSKFDWSTMQLESLSHTGRVEITNGNNINFIFDAINLPDSTTDEPNSHGFITYKIKPKSNVGVGDVFSNTADIFFDYNLPITTNTATTEIIDTLYIETFETTNISIFPNPANNILNIKGTNAINAVTIYDLNGRLLKQLSFPQAKNTHQIDIDRLSNGIYFLEIRTGISKETLKFIKE